jgi:hypothetical protein
MEEAHARQFPDRTAAEPLWPLRRRTQPGTIDPLFGLSPYTANLCPLSAWIEFAGFRENFGESIGELIETMPVGGVRQRTTDHFDGMLSEQ